MHFKLPLQIEVNEVGNKLEIGFLNTQTFSRFFKPIKAFLLNETMLLDCKFNSFKLIKSLKVPSSILVIRLMSNLKYWSELSPLNVDGSIFVN